MEKFEKFEADKSFVATIRNLERELFPEFKNETLYSPEGVNYFYFAPSWHIEAGLLTENDIELLRRDETRKLLSVGAGAAHLERLLVKMGVAQESIFLVDENASTMPPEFERMEFDMYGQWPDFERKRFDRIIFPESVLLNVRFRKHAERRNGLRHIIASSLPLLTQEGVMCADGHSQLAANVGEVIQSLQREGHTVSVHYDDVLLKVKKEPTAVRNIQLETATRTEGWLTRDRE
jgi:hypothetical protein